MTNDETRGDCLLDDIISERYNLAADRLKTFQARSADGINNVRDLADACFWVGEDLQAVVLSTGKSNRGVYVLEHQSGDESLIISVDKDDIFIYKGEKQGVKDKQESLDALKRYGFLLRQAVINGIRGFDPLRDDLGKFNLMTLLRGLMPMQKIADETMDRFFDSASDYPFVPGKGLEVNFPVKIVFDKAHPVKIEALDCRDNPVRLCPVEEPENSQVQKKFMMLLQEVTGSLLSSLKNEELPDLTS